MLHHSPHDGIYTVYQTHMRSVSEIIFEQIVCAKERSESEMCFMLYYPFCVACANTECDCAMCANTG